MVGTRSSDVARLSVHVKPAFIEDPEDVTAREGDDVSLHCKVACVLYLVIRGGAKIAYVAIRSLHKFM